MPFRTVVERGTKGKKAVAAAIDWPGWSRGAKTADLARLGDGGQGPFRLIPVAGPGGD